jgi:hypothetical protein
MGARCSRAEERAHQVHLPRDPAQRVRHPHAVAIHEGKLQVADVRHRDIGWAEIRAEVGRSLRLVQRALADARVHCVEGAVRSRHTSAAIPTRRRCTRPRTPAGPRCVTCNPHPGSAGIPEEPRVDTGEVHEGHAGKGHDARGEKPGRGAAVAHLAGEVVPPATRTATGQDRTGMVGAGSHGRSSRNSGHLRRSRRGCRRRVAELPAAVPSPALHRARRHGSAGVMPVGGQSHDSGGESRNRDRGIGDEPRGPGSQLALGATAPAFRGARGGEKRSYGRPHRRSRRRRFPVRSRPAGDWSWCAAARSGRRRSPPNKGRWCPGAPRRCGCARSRSMRPPAPRPKTSTGEFFAALVPSPSWPSRFCPQHHTAACVVSAQVCAAPAAIAFTGGSRPPGAESGCG